MLANSNFFMKIHYIIHHISFLEKTRAPLSTHTHYPTNSDSLTDLARARQTYIQVFSTMQYTGWPKTWHLSTLGRKCHFLIKQRHFTYKIV